MLEVEEEKDEEEHEEDDQLEHQEQQEQEEEEFEEFAPSGTTTTTTTFITGSDCILYELFSACKNGWLVLRKYRRELKSRLVQSSPGDEKVHFGLHPNTDSMTKVII